MWTAFWDWLIMRDWRRWRRAWQTGQAELASVYKELEQVREELAKAKAMILVLSPPPPGKPIANKELDFLRDQIEGLKAALAHVEAERDQIKDSYQGLVELAKAKKAMRRAQLEAYRLWFHGQRKDFLSLSKRFLEISNDNGMQEKHVEDLLKGVDDAGTEQEAGRENPNRGIDHDHPGAHQGGQGAVGDRGSYNHPCHQAGSPQA